MNRLNAIVMFLITLMILTACAGSEETEGNTNENEGDVTSLGDEDADIELSFWLFGANYDHLIEEYVENNPEISINIQQIDMEDHHNNLFTALSSGSGAPDMAAIEISEIDAYQSAEDHFVNLYDLGAEEIRDDYLEWVWEIGSGTDDEFLFGIPTDIGPTAMFYRKDVFEEAGLPSEPEEVEELIQTWEDYRHAADMILQETGTVMSPNPEMVFNALRDQAPEQYFNEQNELILDSSPYIKEAYENTADMIEAGYIGNYGMWTPEWGTGMADGSFATMLGPGWMQDTIRENAPDETNWRIAAMPEGAGNWGGSWITVPAQSEYPEEAYEFLKWLLAPEQQLKTFEQTGMFPSTPEIYELPEFTELTSEYYGGQNTAEIFAESALEVGHVHKGPQYGDVNAEILDGLDNVYDGIDANEEWEDILMRTDQRISR